MFKIKIINYIPLIKYHLIAKKKQDKIYSD